jgi:hypothetical protein
MELSRLWTTVVEAGRRAAVLVPNDCKNRLEHRLQFIATRQVQVEPDGDVFQIGRQSNRMTGQQARGSGAAIGGGHLAQLASRGGVLEVRRQIFEPEDRFDGQSVEMLEERRRSGGEFVDGLGVVAPRQAAGDRPFEQWHPFLRRHGLEEGEHALLFHRFDHDKRMGGANESTEIVHAGGDRHRCDMLSRGRLLTKQRGDCGPVRGDAQTDLFDTPVRHRSP